jgi:hypothetical protein
VQLHYSRPRFQSWDCIRDLSRSSPAVCADAHEVAQQGVASVDGSAVHVRSQEAQFADEARTAGSGDWRTAAGGGGSGDGWSGAELNSTASRKLAEISNPPIKTPRSKRAAPRSHPSDARTAAFFFLLQGALRPGGCRPE